MGVNNLPKVVTRQRGSRVSNSQPLSHQSDILATRLSNLMCGFDLLMTMMMLQTSVSDDEGSDHVGLSNGLDHCNTATSSQRAINNVDGFNSSTTVTASLLMR